MHNFRLINCDTDGIMVCKPDMSPFLDSERKELLTELNELFPLRIRWEDDDPYESVVVVRAKNYLMRSYDGKLTIKGSAFKGAQKELALKEFMKQLTTALMDGFPSPEVVYNKYVQEILSLKNINRWSSKKTVTHKVLSPTRTNEQRVLDALSGDEREGDKVLVYFTPEGILRRAEEWKGDHCQKRLLKKLYDTLKIFSTVLDVKAFPNYSLKRHKGDLENFSRSQIDTNTQSA